MTMFNQHTGRLSPQSMLQQRYMIVGLAGRGGMSAVYQGVDTRLQRRIAIKEMSQAKVAPADMAAAEARFEQEARILGALSHPNLPRIQDSFSEYGRSYLVMDYIEGKTLHQLMKDGQGQPLPVAQVIFYALQLCAVLDYLHQQHPPIIFRDVKPSNIMVQPDGHLYLIDFGIARFFKEEQALDTVFLGSPGYAPPEQHGVSQTNPRSDIYGLGATLHYCLTGRDPYYAKEQFAFAPIRTLNPQVPVELDQLIQSMIAQDEQQRPASIQEVAATLQRIGQTATSHTTAIQSPAHSANAATQPFMAPNPTSPQPVVSAALPPTRPALQFAPQAVFPAQAPTVGIPGINSKSLRTTTTPFWTPAFSILFALLLLVTIGGSAFALYTTMTMAYGWCFIATAAIALIQLIVFAVVGSNIQVGLSRLLVIITSITTLLVGFFALTLGWLDLQYIINRMMTLATLQQLLTGIFIAMALLSLLWLIRPFTRSQRITFGLLFIVAALCMFLRTTVSNTQLANYALLLGAFTILLLGQTLALRAESLYDRAIS